MGNGRIDSNADQPSTTVRIAVGKIRERVTRPAKNHDGLPNLPNR